MKKQRFQFLLDETKLQTNFAIISINHFNVSYGNMNSLEWLSEEQRNATYEFWYFLQNYVVSLGNISKILFGSFNPKDTPEKRMIRNKERRILRETIGIPDNIILRDKKMRNLLEHIDENIEKFTDSPPNIISNRGIIPSYAFNVNGENLFEHDINNLRNYLTDKNELILFGKKINISNSFSEVINLRDLVVIAEKKFERGELDDLFSDS